MNVLLVRADGIGDALCCVPLLAALHDAGHAVGVVLGTANSSIFARRAVRAVHVLERIPWPRHGSTAGSRNVALAQVRAARYDVALVASEEMDAYAFAHDAGIARRVGYANGWEKPFKTLRVSRLLTKMMLRPASAARACEHEVETIFRLGAGLCDGSVPSRDALRLGALVLDVPARAHGRVVLQVSRKLDREGLDLPAYVALARDLIANGARVLAIGDDPEWLVEIARESGAGLRANLSLKAWKACIAGARALVTPDSGAAHIAGMLGVPCVDCFPMRTTTVRDIARWHPWAARYRAHVLDPAHDRAETGGALAQAALELLA
jgi:ADP-heptose:LPS heptosyltransferase